MVPCLLIHLPHYDILIIHVTQCETDFRHLYISVKQLLKVSLQLESLLTSIRTCSRPRKRLKLSREMSKIQFSIHLDITYELSLYRYKQTTQCLSIRNYQVKPW